MTNETRIAQLEAELYKTKASLHQLRTRLVTEEAAFRRRREGGHNIPVLRDEIYLMELALEGIETDLFRARQPQPVRIPVDKRLTESYEQWLKRARSEVVLRRDQRHATHEAQVQSVLGPYREMSEADRAILYRNHFGESEASRRKADENDAKVLAEIDRLLTELDQPEAAAS